MADDQVQVAIDDERCIGSGMCEMLEEAIFLVDDDTNIAGVIGEAMLPHDRALIAIDRCPSSAISIVEAAVEPSSEEE